ncbi:hypothetical protein SASPL_120876 [Salvia splendens]|uniref:Myb/SANT-like domain-containing protein n=1 Tax=Salvia splendens TaxID=180675 RepID=A0A8X8XTU5_SALSN|nr:hypothetical protein SASPL_128453 [Salvia splendens]KAG6418672.1 hypothetical protein SASPL_120876 [Salvia splendens]
MGKWTAAMDTLLLSTVIKMRAGRASNDDSVTEAELNEACKVIKLRFSTEITCADVVSRLELLRVRYETFNKVVSTPGVRWDLDDKLITNPLAGAYYYRDEDEYSRLTTMFGLHGVKKEPAKEVITISDTTELIVITDSPVPYAPTRGKHGHSLAEQEEVNSPFIDPPTLVRRKLFDEPSMNYAEVSSSVDAGRVGSFNQTQTLPVKQLYSSPNGSSCASWSPAAASRKAPL